jgi:hypothetical protein
VTIIDYHFTQVILYYARKFAIKTAREEKAAAKKNRAEERYKNFYLGIEEGQDNEEGKANPVIIPKKVRLPLKKVNGVALPDGLEIPGHWESDLNRQLDQEKRVERK